MNENNKVPFALVYHFNQDLIPLADLTADICFMPLLKTFAAHPEIACHFHIAGTTLNFLTWENPAFIDMVKDMIKEERLELLGSTYAQSMLFCSSKWENLNAARHHRDIYKQVFGYTPGGFWNPEKSWTHSFISLVKEMGYSYSLIEEHVLAESGVENNIYAPRRGLHGSDELILFTDSSRLTKMLNDLIFNFSDEKYDVLVNHIVEAGAGGGSLMCYCEDAEAYGLWQFESGENNKHIYENLDKFFSYLKHDSRVEPILMSNYSKQQGISETLTKSVNGQAKWMLEALHDSGARWHEQEYSTWFDFQEHSPKIKYLKKFYGGLVKQIRSAEKKIPTGKAGEMFRNLLDSAGFTLAVHQHEYGLTGIDYQGFTRWELARCCLVYIRCAEWLIEGKTGVFEYDINEDGTGEIIYVDKWQMLVFSRQGGRVLYWIDTVSGLQIAGNENPAYASEHFTNDHAYIPDLSKDTPLWFWIKESRHSPCFDKKYKLRRRLQNDILSYELADSSTGNIKLYDHEMAAEYEDKQLRFHCESSGFSIEKVFTMNKTGFTVIYRINTPGGQPADLALFSENSFSPDLKSLMYLGKSVINSRQNKITAGKYTITLESKSSLAFENEYHVFAACINFMLEAKNSSSLQTQVNYNLKAKK